MKKVLLGLLMAVLVGCPAAQDKNPDPPANFKFEPVTQVASNLYSCLEDQTRRKARLCIAPWIKIDKIRYQIPEGLQKSVVKIVKRINTRYQECSSTHVDRGQTIYATVVLITGKQNSLSLNFSSSGKSADHVAVYQAIQRIAEGRGSCERERSK